MKIIVLLLLISLIAIGCGSSRECKGSPLQEYNNYNK